MHVVVLLAWSLPRLIKVCIFLSFGSCRWVLKSTHQLCKESGTAKKHKHYSGFWRKALVVDLGLTDNRSNVQKELDKVYQSVCTISHTIFQSNVPTGHQSCGLPVSELPYALLSLIRFHTCFDVWNSINRCRFAFVIAFCRALFRRLKTWMALCAPPYSSALHSYWFHFPQ